MTIKAITHCTVIHGRECNFIFKLGYSNKLFGLNSSVVDDSHDRYKTANIEIIQLFLNA
jgi:hypothetical protein